MLTVAWTRRCSQGSDSDDFSLRTQSHMVWFGLGRDELWLNAL